MKVQSRRNRSEISTTTHRKVIRPRRTAAVPKPSEFRKLPKTEQDRLFREQAVHGAEMYLERPDILVSDSEPVHQYK